MQQSCLIKLRFYEHFIYIGQKTHFQVIALHDQLCSFRNRNNKSKYSIEYICSWTWLPAAYIDLFYMQISAKSLLLY